MAEYETFTGLYWHSSEPTITSFDVGGSEIKRSVIDNYFSIETTGNRFCIGYFDSDTESRIPCLDMALIQQHERQGSQCPVCTQKSRGSFVAKTGKITTEYNRSLLKYRHIVYIASFGDQSSVKVGVARQSRYSDRIHEQGATAAAVIAYAAEGVAARGIEKAISEHLNIKQSVRYQEKIKNILNNDTREAAYSRLKLCQERIEQTLLDQNIVYDDFIFASPDYRIQESAIGEIIHFIDKLDSISYIGGRVIGILGKIALFHVSGACYAINTKILEGREMRIQTHTDTTVGKVFGIHTKRVAINRQQGLF
jgi:hypothetical protein